MKNKLISLVVLIVVALFLWLGFQHAHTSIAFVNFRESTLAELEKANQSRFISIIPVEKTSNYHDLVDADVIYTFHLGLLTEEQKTNLEKARSNGAKVYMYNSTSQEFSSDDFSAEQSVQVQAYLTNGGLANYESLLGYSAQIIAEKTMFTPSFNQPKTYPKEVFYRIGTELYFETIADYWNDYQKNGLLKPNGKKVAIVNTSANPQMEYRSYQDSLILKLERKGINVVVLGGFIKRLDMLKAVNPDLVIFFAHGRLSSVSGDKSVEWLKEQNIPLLNPQLISQPIEDWENDQQGMTGPLFGQNLVVPEIDGAIYPYAIAAQTKKETDYYTYTEIPGKLDRFTQVVENWLNLKETPNSDKKVAIYYYKGAGQNAMVAGQLEVGKSLLSILNHLKEQGFDTGNRHPKSEEELLQRIMKEGPVYGDYAKGSLETYVKEGNPDLIPVDEYLSWIQSEIDAEAYKEVEALYGNAPGTYSTTQIDGKSYIVIPRIEFGNIALLPVLPSALGETEYKMVHGVKKAPPHAYIASYLWSRMKFKADVISHWGTHGNLEFTPWKQAGLSLKDWPEILIAPLPHVYVYSINNVGEAMMAKRRTQATMVTHLTSPLDEAELYGSLKELNLAVSGLQETTDEAFAVQYKKKIRTLLDSTSVKKDLELTDAQIQELDEETVAQLSHYLFHLNAQKIEIGLHAYGVPYSEDEIEKTVRMMGVDALASALQTIELIEKPSLKQSDLKKNLDKHRTKALAVIQGIYRGNEPLSYMKAADLALLQRLNDRNQSSDEKILALEQLKNVLESIPVYKQNLKASFDAELNSYVNGLNGGYIAPTPGGDPAVNPWTVPTGRNLYSVNAENTPTKEAWNVGKQLGDLLLQKHISKHGDYPKKLAFTLWSSEFIRDNGMNIAQILYMIGAEPLWNKAGRVYDVQLIPIEKLGRPRIDVIVQTSGQLRDIAASRLTLINKAVALAAQEGTSTEQNFVKAGSVKAEGLMKEKGLSPADAQRLANKRVFGGVNGSYGTAIMGMVEKGDVWESEDEIAQQYLKNMGALYDEDAWSEYKSGVFETMISDAEGIVHPRSSNVTGPISLDHVYEFMGGLTLTIRNVTGKDPDGYFNDYRNKYNPFVQDLKEAIWAETRTNLFNPKFIKAQMKEGATAAELFAENFRDTYGWNVMKPDAIDKEIWEGYHEIYVQDKLKLGTVEFFKDKNPYALQEMTAVMLETIRKGYWNPSESVKKEIAALHVELIKENQAGCSGFVCDNAKLAAMISDLSTKDDAKAYNEALNKVQNAGSEQMQGMILTKEEISLDKLIELVKDNSVPIYTLSASIFLIGIVFTVGVIRKRQRA
ncbi:cobaltochelatase subunit CobN [bacterium]|nr:MAG: cobaltochelatase subunit CobN [bacterium]